MQTINICPCYKLQCLVLENWLRQWKNKEKTDTQTQGQKNPAHSTGAPTKQQGSRTLARYYVQCSMRGKAHLSGRFLYTSSLRCGPLEGGSCSCLCLQTGHSPLNQRRALSSLRAPPWRKTCHLPGSEALELLTWLYPCQQYTFTLEFFQSLHIRLELPQHPMCPFTINVPLTVICMLVKSVSLPKCYCI